MFKRASSRLVRSGSKDSKDSDVSMVSNDAMVRIGRATKTGTLHANEDRSTVVETMNDVLDEEVVTVSEILEFDLKNSGDLLEKVMYAAVFDGHGGAGCANYLSRNLHLRLAKHIEAAQIESLFDPQAPAIVSRTFKEVDDEFAEAAKEPGDSSGSCVALAMVAGQDVLIAHTGDCRAVLRSCGDTVVVTKDHRAEDPVEAARIQAAGGIVVEGRLNGILCPSRSFGDSDVKSLTKGDALICTPDVGRHSVDIGAPGKITSFLILATDGLWDVMDVDVACNFVEKVLKKTGSADVAAARLVETAGKHNHDDVTVVIIAWQRLKPSKESSKVNVKSGLSQETPFSGATPEDEINQLGSPQVSRKNYNPDAKIPKKN